VTVQLNMDASPDAPPYDPSAAGAGTYRVLLFVRALWKLHPKRMQHFDFGLIGPRNVSGANEPYLIIITVIA
jgi:hypothetical protein